MSFIVSLALIWVVFMAAWFMVSKYVKSSDIDKIKTRLTGVGKSKKKAKGAMSSGAMSSLRTRSSRVRSARRSSVSCPRAAVAAASSRSRSSVPTSASVVSGGTPAAS